VTEWLDRDKENQGKTSQSTDKGQIAVVTGASGGMGRATAALLAADHDMKVLLIVRDAERGQAAVDEVNLLSGRCDAEMVLCDLASLVSIRTAAAEISNRVDHIDVLVNNAGVITLNREETEDGFERQLGVNHLGHFLLTGLLLPLLQRSGEARIIVVSSAAHKIGRMDYNDPGMSRGFRVWNAYGRSKLANIWFARELAARLTATKVTVNALHPGAVSTDIGVDRKSGFGRLVHKLLKPFFLTPEKGSETTVYLATAPELAGQSGGYYYRKKLIRPSARAEDKDEALRFWEWSEQATAFLWESPSEGSVKQS
jgi:NAD(P)-dependent dehydrogenase (short-subunit alcohol dehydrogenase family)